MCAGGQGLGTEYAAEEKQGHMKAMAECSQLFFYLHKSIVLGMLEILKQTNSKWWHLACKYILRVPLTKHPSS